MIIRELVFEWGGVSLLKYWSNKNLERKREKNKYIFF